MGGARVYLSWFINVRDIIRVTPTVAMERLVMVHAMQITIHEYLHARWSAPLTDPHLQERKSAYSLAQWSEETPVETTAIRFAWEILRYLDVQTAGGALGALNAAMPGIRNLYDFSKAPGAYFDERLAFGMIMSELGINEEAVHLRMLRMTDGHRDSTDVMHPFGRWTPTEDFVPFWDALLRALGDEFGVDVAKMGAAEYN